MSGIVMMLLVLVIVAAVVVVIVQAMSENRTGEKREKEGTGKKVRDLQVDAVEMKRKKEPVREDPEVTEAKKELYQYLTQVIKKMFLYYRRGNWDTFTRVNLPSDKVMRHYDTIKKSLTTQSAEILDAYFSCVDREGTEEQKPGQIREPERLKEVFLCMVLPFYPVYYDRLDGIRYTSLLNQTMLNLFHRLTGKKFRMGYKNRYSSGVTAYRWKGDRYQVYAEDGKMLCDAVFKDGKVWEGFACLPEEGQKAGEDWQLVREGHFQEGVFTDGTLHYIYKKRCGEL